MSDNESTGSNHAPLPPLVADRLLELLSTDDRFRALFQRDPAAALAQAGHDLAGQYAGKSTLEQGEPFYCMTSQNLAPKQEIAAAREELKHFLTSQTDHYVVFCFEAGKIASTLRTR